MASRSSPHAPSSRSRDYGRGEGEEGLDTSVIFSTITARLGLQTVSSLERCPLFRVAFTERFHCTTPHWVHLPLAITNLVFEKVPPLGVGGEVKLLQGNSHLSQELVPPEAVPVPHTQPESAAQQGRLRHLVLQWEGEQQNTTQHNRCDLLHIAY